MGKSFRQLFKEYFFFLKKDRDGVMVLIILILVAIIGHLVILKIEISPQIKNTEWVQAFEIWENQNKNLINSHVLFCFDPNVVSAEQIDSLSIPEFLKNNIIRYREAGGKYSQASDLRKIYGMNDSLYNLILPYLFFPDEEFEKTKVPNVTEVVVEAFDFDPNFVSLEDMMRLGFTSFQASNVEKYRKQGGTFFNPHDLLKIYGLDTTFYFSIVKHICINKNLIQRVEKNPAAKVYVELNSADSLELVGLKGIGPVFASRILKYRNLLGGFYSVSQLLEVYGFPEETYLNLKDNFIIDTLKVKKLRINFVDYTDLLRHPYLGKEHVEAILNHRQEKGPFPNKNHLLVNGLVDSLTFENMKPYITCR